MVNNISSDIFNMSFRKKSVILIIFFFLITSAFSKDIPTGYRGITLGMSLDETKDALLKDASFGYHGDRDVSLIPGTNKILIETDANSGHGSIFLERCWFQFYDDELFIITININTQKMDYYSVFTKLTEKYGKPDTFSPQSATWKNENITMSLEKPLTLKYMDNDILKNTQNYSNIEESPEEQTRDMFLDEL